MRRIYNMWNGRPPIKISPEILLKVQKKLDQVIKILTPYLAALSPADKLPFRKSGSGLIKFLEMSYALAVECPDLFPMYIKTEVFREEYFTTRELWSLADKINQFSECVSDTVILSCDRTMETALAFYQTVKVAARRDFPGARIIFDDLKSALPYSAKRRKKTAEEIDRQLILFDDL